MIGVEDKCLGIADDDVQPMEKTGVGIVGAILMGIAFQRWDVTAIAIATDDAAVGKCGVGKFLHGCLLDIGCHPHFQIAGIALSIQGQRHKNLSLFRPPAPLFSGSWATKVRIIKLNDTVQLMHRVPLVRILLSIYHAVL